MLGEFMFFISIIKIKYHLLSYPWHCGTPENLIRLESEMQVSYDMINYPSPSLQFCTTRWFNALYRNFQLLHNLEILEFQSARYHQWIPYIVSIAGKLAKSDYKSDHLNFLSSDFSPLLTCTRATEETMNSSLMILVVVGVALLGWAEAGCSQDGCCYCHKEQGYILTEGLYQEDCNYGCK